jgi:hypothetical protein
MFVPNFSCEALFYNHFSYSSWTVHILQNYLAVPPFYNIYLLICRYVCVYIWRDLNITRGKANYFWTKKCRCMIICIPKFKLNFNFLVRNLNPYNLTDMGTHSPTQGRGQIKKILKKGSIFFTNFYISQFINKSVILHKNRFNVWVS